ncbi:Crp/Fnr family transcriptional regulator [Microscilla marina]|uniref:Catabolite gene activator protein n=1 Tax=Microscilla marina ATCC 23134 TaxID=313606 RepID=A1ZFX9_MICM2|nr:Crp/Fnr family transcriptional regulator [Microscilla marina]EAY30903.1 catabolite gene activator protein [Microscilla marina ATCC 23134]
MNTTKNNTPYLEQFKQSMHQYSPISNESFEQIQGLTRLQHIKKGAYLVPVNQVAKKMYFVCKGILVSQFLTNDGHAHIKNFFLENSFAASTVSLLQQTPSMFDIWALEDTVLLEFDHGQYKQLVHRIPELSRFHIAYLEQSWVIKNEQRQIAFATQTSAERYRAFLTEYPTLDKRVPQLHIASYLGITPTQLSRLRKDLQGAVNTK